MIYCLLLRTVHPIFVCNTVGTHEGTVSITETFCLVIIWLAALPGLQPRFELAKAERYDALMVLCMAYQIHMQLMIHVYMFQYYTVQSFLIYIASQRVTIRVSELKGHALFIYYI